MRRLVAHFTDSPAFGGAEQMLLALVRGLQESGCEQVLLHHERAGITRLVAGVRALGVRTLAVPPMPEGAAGAARVPGFVAELYRLRPTVFHAHLTWSMACKFPLAGALAARVPAVVATHQLFVDFPLTLSRRVQQRILGLGVDRHVAVSRHVAERLLSSFPWLRGRVVVIPNAVDLSRARAPRDEQLRRELTGGVDAPLILVPARLDEQKGQRYAIDAVRDRPSLRLVLAGDGPERASLEAHARDVGVAERVLFLGERSDVPRLLATCDVALLPSLYEGLPVAALEAMAAGRPLIATCIGGTREAVTDGVTGLLVQPGSAAALAEAIDALLANPALAESLARSGRADVEARFSIEQLVRRNLRLYEECAGR